MFRLVRSGSGRKRLKVGGEEIYVDVVIRNVRGILQFPMRFSEVSPTS